MRAAIYNPYLETLGGGERYTMAVATVLIDIGWQVDVEWQDTTIKSKLEDRFGINLGKVNFIPDIKKGENYDVCFWLSDGSIPILHARKNLLHFQVPFHGVKGKSLINRMKLFRISKVICNSQFTKRVIDEEYGVDSLVIYPPVDVAKLKPKRKENIILSVGRFSHLKQAKRQDVLIDEFKKLSDAGFSDWQFVLAGGVEVGADVLVTELEQKIGHYPITIRKSPKFSELGDLYGKARIFWSAAGYGVNEIKEPERVEHFGISVVEAMTAKAVPVVYKAGGHKEVVENDVNGFLWKDGGELLRMTKKLITNPKLMNKVSLKADLDSKKFGYSEFAKSLTALI